MKLTRQHFKLIAAVLRRAQDRVVCLERNRRPADVVAEIFYDFCGELAESNPNFNAGKFRSAVYPQENRHDDEKV